jgi:transposase
MNFVGIDLHKKSITLCVMDQDRNILDRKRFFCSEPERMVGYFRELGAFQAVVEATASYEWFVRLIEPMAEKVVLAHPKKLRVIAESTRKSDKLDAEVLAEFLVRDMVPLAHRPTPRQRQHRALVRHRYYVRRRIGSVRNKIRRILSDYNADRPDLFSREGLVYLSQVQVCAADRFILDQLREEWEQHLQRLRLVERHLRQFAKQASTREAEARAVLNTLPSVGPVTVDVVISEVGDVDRFGSAKQVCAYAGLVPGRRSSEDRTRDLGITKEGSRLLRWALVEAAWRLVRRTNRWRTIFDALAHRRGKKKAIVAVARRLLCVMVAMLRSGQAYRPALVRSVG